LEISVIGSVLAFPVLSQSFIVKLKDYKFNAPYRNYFYKEIEKCYDKNNVVSVAMMTVIMNSSEQYKEQIISTMEYSDSINFISHLEMLVQQQIYHNLSTGYVEYLSRISKTEPIEEIISDNMDMILDMDITSERGFNITQQSLAQNMLKAVSEKTYGDKVYKTGDDELDELLQISKRNIILIGGKSGGLKTKLSMKIIKGLVKNNKEVSILHYAMEDSAEQLTRGYISMDLRLMDDELSNRGYKMTDHENLLFQNQLKKMSKYDIEYVNKASYIKEIGAHFLQFQAKRKGKFCLLVIDNFMKIQDQFDFSNSVKADDYISSVIDSWNIKTSSEEVAVMILHHFIDEQASQSNKQEGYRPVESFFRGSTRIRDMSTKIMLTNYIGSYQQLHDKYPYAKHTIKRLFIIEFSKNRLGGLGMIRYIAFPEFNEFININKIK
jgi:replicative DNA helicase